MSCCLWLPTCFKSGHSFGKIWLWMSTFILAVSCGYPQGSVGGLLLAIPCSDSAVDSRSALSGWQVNDSWLRLLIYDLVYETESGHIIFCSGQILIILLPKALCTDTHMTCSNLTTKGLTQVLRCSGVYGWREANPRPLNRTLLSQSSYPLKKSHEANHKVSLFYCFFHS